MSDFKTKYGKWAVITGGSSGIGLAFAHLLAEKKMNVLIIARDETKLQKARNEILKTNTIEVKTLSINLLEENAVSIIEEYTKDLDIGIAVINAGMELTGHFIKRTSKQHQDLIQLNITVPTQISHLFSKRFVAKKRGGIILISSLLGYQGVPLFTTYCASKSFILNFGEGLSVELKPYGVDVIVLAPGPTKTKMLDNMDVDFSKMPIKIMDTHSTAKPALKYLGKRISVVPGLLNKIYAFENRFLPRKTPIKLFGFLVKRALKKSKHSDYLIS